MDFFFFFFLDAHPPVLAQVQQHTVGFIDAFMLPLSRLLSLPSLQKLRSGVTGQGRESPIVNWPFQLNREVKGRRRVEDNGVSLALHSKSNAHS